AVVVLDPELVGAPGEVGRERLREDVRHARVERLEEGLPELLVVRLDVRERRVVGREHGGWDAEDHGDLLAAEPHAFEEPDLLTGQRHAVVLHAAAEDELVAGVLLTEAPGVDLLAEGPVLVDAEVLGDVEDAGLDRAAL